MKFKAIASVKTYCHAIISAPDQETAEAIANQMDGGDFITSDELGDWNIELVEPIGKVVKTKAKPVLKPYTVVWREAFRDGGCFIKVEAVNAYEAQKIAKKKFLKENDLTAKDEVYLEYTFAGWVTILNDTSSFETPAKELKKL